MTLYEKFLKRKQNGETLNIKELSPKNLEILFIEESISDNMIASLIWSEKFKSQLSKKEEWNYDSQLSHKKILI